MTGTLTLESRQESSLKGQAPSVFPHRPRLFPSLAWPPPRPQAVPSCPWPMSGMVQLKCLGVGGPACYLPVTTLLQFKPQLP